jgi:PAS domain S-box-containing protein
MSPSGVPSIRLTERWWRGIILALSAAVILFTLWCLTHGITTVFMHLYYFPIVLIAYHYRWKGFGLATLLALSYIALVAVFDTSQWDVLLGAVYRFLVFVGIAAIIAYLSERLAMETRAAGESTEIRERYIAIAPAIILALDRNGTITYLNAKGGEILECIPDEVIGTSWFDRFLRDNEREPVKTVFANLMAGQAESGQAFENRVLTGSGTEKIIRWHNTGLHDESGAITGTLAFGEDITEEKQAQDILRSMQQFQESVIANANVWITVLAPDGTILVWNDAAEAISGYKKTDVIGKNTIWKQLYPDNHYRKKVTEEIRRIIARDTILENFETEIRCEDRTTRTIVWNTRALRDDRGIITSYIAIGRDVTAQKAAVFRAGESSRFLGTMIDTLPMPIFFKDTGGRYLGCNQSFEEYIGLKRDSLIGRSVYDISPKDLADKYAAADQQLFDNPVPQRYETQVEYADGSYHDVIFYKTPFFNKDGSLGGLIGAFLDITDRKQAQEALRKSEEKFRIIADFTFDWEYWVAPDGTYTYMTPSCERITGYSAEQFYQKPSLFEEIIHPDDRTAYQQHMDLSSHSPGPESVEYRIIRRDGSIRWISHICQPMINRDGNLLGRRSSNRDDTERKLAEMALRENEEKYRAFFTTSRDCVFITTLNGNWLDFNDAAVGMFGYDSREDLLKIKVSDVYVNPAERDAHIRHIHDNSYSFEYPVDLRKKDGSVINTLITTVARKDSSGAIIGFQGSIRDITERKRTEKLLLDNQVQLATAMALAHLANWEFDVPTGIFTFNDRFYALYGTTAEREGGYQIPAEVYAREFVHPDDAGMVAIEVGKAITSTDPGYVSNVEHRIIRRDGEIRHIIVRIGITKDAEGRTIKTHGANQDITEQKLAEEALERSHAVLKSVIESPKEVVIFALDQQYRYIAFNENHRHTMKQIWGVDIALGISMPEYISNPDDRKKAIVNFDRALSGESFTLVEAYGDTALERRWYENAYNPITDPNGSIIGLTLFLTDVTDRIQMEQDLIESRQRMIDIINFLPDPTFAIDAEGRVIAWNKAIEDLLEVPSGEILGKGDYESSFRMFGRRRPSLINLVIHGDDTLMKKHYPTLHRDGQMLTAELDIEMLRGKRRVLWIIATPLYDAGGNVTGAIESMRDITKIKETEEELNRINRNLDTLVQERTKKLEDEVAQRRKAEGDVVELLRYTRSVIEANPDLIVVLDEKGIILDTNAASELLTGIPKEQLTGTQYFGYLVEDGTVQSAFAGLLQEGTIENLVRIRHTDGHDTPLSVHATVIRGMDGKNDKIIVAAHDITRQKHDEEALRALLDEQVLLLREVHHRVKNNLQIIISLVNLQMRQTGDPAVKQIMSETQNRVRAMSLVHEKLYRSESLSQIDFADYTRFLATQLFSYYSMDTRRVRLDFAMGKIMVDINTAVPLGLLMNELISNALKHAFPNGREGTISISGSEEDNLITLIVRDNGIGMPKELDWKNTTSLGMRLVISLVDQIDGTIELDRSAGTSFSIELQMKG